MTGLIIEAGGGALAAAPSNGAPAAAEAGAAKASIARYLVVGGAAGEPLPLDYGPAYLD